MTIDQAYQFIQFICNKIQNGNITPNQFNMLAPIAQMSLINQLLGNEQEYQPGKPVPRYGFGLNQKIKEDLRPLFDTTTLTFVAGSAAYPGSSIYIFDLGLSSDETVVRPVDLDEWRILNKSQIKPPTIQYPYYIEAGENVYIKPNTIGSALATYIKIPTDPKWNYTIVSNVPVYSASGSQDFQLGPLTHLRICTKILAAVGINLSLDQVTAYAMAMEAQGA